MKTYSITEEQLEELAAIDTEWPEEVARLKELIAEIRKHILIPAERMRAAFQQSYAVTRDDLQKGLLAQYQGQPISEQQSRQPF